MSKYIGCALAVALLLSVSTCVLAVGKTTVDPNAGDVVAVDSPKPIIDARLNQKVTYEARRKSVLVIMNELSAATGITFKAGYNDKDWQVRDRKMNIFARDVPLSELMNSMAHVMKFKWKRTGKDGDYNYRFFMDRKALLDADNQALRAEERLRQMQNEKRRGSLDAYSKLGTLSLPELEKLKSTNPFMYLLAKSGLSKSLGTFFDETPAAADAIASGQEMTLSGGSLSAAGQQGLFGAMQDMWRLGKQLSHKDEPNPFTQDVMSMLGQVPIQINRNIEDISGNRESSFLAGQLQMGDLNIPFFDPESNIARLIGKMAIRSLEGNIPIDDISKSLETEIKLAIETDHKLADTGEPIIEHPDHLYYPDNPNTEAKIKLKAGSRSLEDIEADLAEASGMAVVSDSFGRLVGSPNLKQDEMELRDALDRVAEAFHYNWDRRALVLELRDRDWFRKRGLQVPEEWLEKWRQTLKKTGTLDIGDLSQIAILTQEQYNANISGDESLESGGLPGVVFALRDVLRVYAAMSDGQRDALFGTDGLDLQAFDDSQWPLVEKLLNRRNVDFLANPDAQITFTCTRKQQEKQYEYTFTVRSSEVEKPMEWKFSTPKYVEPKPAEVKPAK